MYKLFYSEEVVKMTKMNIMKDRIRIEEEIEAVIDGEVKPLGNGAMVIASKKYIGKKAYVVIRRRK
jgi:putative transposon-encoded protein